MFQGVQYWCGKTSATELENVKHYFIASHSIQEAVNAGTFEQYALKKVNELFRKHDVAIIVGGTGLYIKAFCEGLDDMPSGANGNPKVNHN